MRQTIFAIQVNAAEILYETNAPKEVLRQVFDNEMTRSQFMTAIKDKGYEVKRLQADMYIGFSL